ncbi:MAG: protein kinase [Planctomycetales bacterium]|nr:protein kinase [Planctomycetales bacterium]
MDALHSNSKARQHPDVPPDGTSEEWGSEDPVLDALVQEFLSTWRSGVCVSVDHFVNQHPQHAAKLQDLLPPLLVLEGFAVRAISSNEQLDELGNYQLKRIIGRGGMGVVYEALLSSEDRQVALKVMSSERCEDSISRQRFEREARIVQKLNHENIVPILEVGIVENRMYFSMPIIHGCNVQQLIYTMRSKVGSYCDRDASCKLDGPQRAYRTIDLLTDGTQVNDSCPTLAGTSQQNQSSNDPNWRVNELPTSPSVEGMPWTLACLVSKTTTIDHSQSTNELPLPFSDSHWQLLATCGYEIAQALHHAHQSGIIHRDVKPSNILLDHEGKFWVTDFGLAKDLDGGLTLSGTVLGTLRYMAPEQLAGKATIQSDIYGLGQTLCELACLLPNDQDVESSMLARIPTGPSMPIAFWEQVPSELQKVLYRMVMSSPADRYQDAWELANDFSRFLSGTPVKASFPGWRKRAAWWLHQHVMAVVAACLLLVVGALTCIVMSKSRRDSAPPSIVAGGHELFLGGQDRTVAEWVIENGGWIYVLSDLGPGQARTMDQIPSQIFNVTAIKLEHCQQLDLRILKEMIHLPQMSQLVLNFSNFDQAWAPVFLERTNLISLQLNYCNLTDQCMPTLGRLDELQYLGLNGNDVSNNGVAHLSMLSDMLELKLLGNRQLDDQCLNAFKKMPFLELLDLRDTGVSAAAASEFHAQMQAMIHDARLLQGEIEE